MKRFSKGRYRPLQFPQKNVSVLQKDPPLFRKLITLRWSILGCFYGIFAVRQGCPTPLRLSELANAIFICLCSCCTADTDNTSIVSSASTNRELARLNNPWIGSNLAARLDFSLHSTGADKDQFLPRISIPSQFSLTPVYQYIIWIIAQSSTCQLLFFIFPGVLLYFQVQTKAGVLAVTHTHKVPARLGKEQAEVTSSFRQCKSS